MDSTQIKKPDHVKDHIWRQHVAWADVVNKQLDENLRQHQKLTKKVSVKG